MRRKRDPRALFPVNVWPPFVDALTLVLAVMVLLLLFATAVHGRMADRLQASLLEAQHLRDQKAQVERRLRALAPAGTIEVEEGKVILQGEVLFPSGSDELSSAGRATLARMAKALAQLIAEEPDQMILVGGHTDDVPIATARFASNWELSTARATAVARALTAGGLPPDRVVASGFSSFHPRASIRGAEGRRRSRRIEILVVPIRAVSSR